MGCKEFIDWTILQKLPVNNFKWIEDLLNLIFIAMKNYMNFIIIFHFLSERIKIKKFGKLATNLHNKSEYIIHIRNFKQVLNHGLVLKKLHRVTEFNQKVWQKT